MFTGIIKGVGEIKNIQARSEGKKISIKLPPAISGKLEEGGSLAVDGVCLTAEAAVNPAVFSASSETLEKTTLAAAREGRKVNLEPALQAESSLGGHFVSGHVDGTVQIKKLIRRGEDYDLVVELPDRFKPYLVDRGSVALDGISLTVIECTEEDFTCRVVPHTLNNTNLQDKKTGDRLNIEVDILARYVENILKYKTGREDSITAEKLRRSGF